MDQTGWSIIDTAMELVVERGYTATTTRGVTKRAGMNECTIFRKFRGKKETVFQAMEQKRWHPDLEPEDFKNGTGDLTENLCQSARIYMKKAVPEFIKLSLGLRTPELTEGTRKGILTVPLVFKTGVMEHLRKMYDKGKLISDDYENMTVVSLSLNFGFVFSKTSFGGGLTEMEADGYIVKMVDASIHGVTKQIWKHMVPCSTIYFYQIYKYPLIRKGRRMSYYLIISVSLKSGKGRADYDDYIKLVRPIMEKHGGGYVVRSEGIEYTGKN